MICETQEEGAWPIGHPLPLPTWRNLSQQPYYTFTIWQYEELASNIELFVQRLLEDRNYDTVGNFLKLYNLYKTHGSNNLSEFFHRYRPIISTEHHTCVGLALELWYRLQQLNQRFPNLSNHFYLVSCEEAIDTVPEYAGMGDNIQLLADTLEKEHVLLALKINVMGRVGVLLCDPGYHVARVITVMRDKTYPHTGWFTQSSEDSLKKEYNYIFSTTNTKYVEWMERETRGGIQKHQVSLIYTSRPYLTAIDVTERRNLVYDFRSLLSRDTKGHLLAGFYFKVSPGNKEFTVFYQENGRKRRVKMDFDMFLHKNKVRMRVVVVFVGMVVEEWSKSVDK